jgi:hypothetical protein
MFSFVCMNTIESKFLNWLLLSPHSVANKYLTQKGCSVAVRLAREMGVNCTIDTLYPTMTATYDHRNFRRALPVRSAVLKKVTGGLVVKWVTIGESPLLYVFAIPFA